MDQGILGECKPKEISDRNLKIRESGTQVKEKKINCVKHFKTLKMQFTKKISESQPFVNQMT